MQRQEAELSCPRTGLRGAHDGTSHPTIWILVHVEGDVVEEDDARTYTATTTLAATSGAATLDRLPPRARKTEKGNTSGNTQHMQGSPQNMQDNPSYENPSKEIISFLAKRVKSAREKKIIDIIIDPGFGFGKSIEHNFEILSNLEHFSMLDLPILTGFSRKSMIFKTLNTDKENALNGTSVLNTIALMKGLKILRVHDVKEAKECVLLYNKTK